MTVLPEGPFNRAFLAGASVSNFTVETGWDEQSTTLRAVLAEDDKTGDQFTRPETGTPIRFKYETFDFIGIVQSWGDKQSTSGFTYDIVLTDPRELLRNVQVITSDYVGKTTIYVDNIINIYGHYEYGPCANFGTSLYNENGIPWNLVKDAVHTLTEISSTSEFGQPILFKGYQYEVDLSAIPDVEIYYRVAPGITDLLNIISTVCQDSGLNFYVELEEVDAALKQYKITVKTVDRKKTPNLNAIEAFISSHPEVSSKDVGRELRNDYSGAFIIGDKIDTVYVAGNCGSPSLWPAGVTVPQAINDLIAINSFSDCPKIYPIFGFDSKGKPQFAYKRTASFPFGGVQPSWQIADDFSDNTVVVLDSKSLNNPVIGPYYAMEIGEMRAALGGMDSWVAFISTFRQGMAVYINAPEAFSQHYNTHINNQVLQLGLSAIHSHRIIGKALATQVGAVWDDSARYFDALAGASDTKWGIGESIYKFILHYAQTHFGKSFFAELPFHCATLEPDTFKLKTTLEIADSAWWEGGSGPIGPASFFDLTQFQSIDGKLSAYCRYDDVQFIDMVDANVSNMVVDNGGVYVPIQVNPTIFYANGVPGAVFTVNNPLAMSYRSKSHLEDRIMAYANAVDAFRIETIRNKNGKTEKKEIIDDKVKLLIGHLAKLFPGAAVAGEKKIAKGLLFGQEGYLKLPSGPTYYVPNAAALPIRLTQVNYGPWYDQKVPGRVKTEIKQDLNPATYGSINTMNLAGMAFLKEAVTGLQEIERGSVTLPGIPDLKPGSELIANGPNITNISVSINPTDGVTTTYNMQTFTPAYGAFSNANAQRLKTFGIGLTNIRSYIKNLKDIRRGEFSLSLGQSIVNSLHLFYNNFARHGHRHNRSPHDLIWGNISKETAEAVQDNTVGITDTVWMDYEVMTGSADDFLFGDSFIREPKDIMSNVSVMDAGGFFRPVTTKSNTSGFDETYLLPSFIQLTDATVGDEAGFPINVTTLNPFLNAHSENWGKTLGHDLQYVWPYNSSGSTSDPSHNYEEWNGPKWNQNGEDADGYNVMAFRGPIIVTGWGADINGLPIPNKTPDSPTAEFADNWLRRPDLWKTGPVDLRWDDERGVWVGGSQANGFWAVLFDKIKIQMDDDSATTSSDPVFNEPTCPPGVLPLYRGEYSWLEVEPNPYDPGEWRPKANGRFGIAGENDGAWEVNRSNANVHVENMIVWMWKGRASTPDTSSEEVSSEVEIYKSSYDARSTNFRYWFNLCIPREDCANRYVIAAAPNNDVV